jgi:hypothetical protein
VLRCTEEELEGFRNGQGDDRYLGELHLPARRIKMDYGRIVEQRSMGG